MALVEIICADDVMAGGIEKKRKVNKKYSDVVERINLVGWIKGEIEKKAERMIVVKIDDVAKEMGPEFEKADYQKMFQALKVILFKNGIFIRMATHKDGDKTFVLREVEKEEEDQSVKKLTIQEEEKEKERQEKIAMKGEIRKLKEILHGRLGKKSCMIEIFQFNWNTLTWRMVKRLSVRTYVKLIETVMNNTSTTENRYRIEFTPLHLLENMEKELPEDEDSVEQVDNIEGQIKEGIKYEVKGEEKGEGPKEEKVGEMECPRCGGKNINTWPIVQVLKTRSGDRMLRHRCTECNETFSDEDLGIN